MCCVLLMASSCKTRKYLKDGETFLKENEIVFTDKQNVDNWRNLKYELSTLAYQKPNSKVFWVPRRYFYYKVENPNKRKIERRARKDAKRIAKGKDKKKRNFSNWIRKSIAEEPAIYDKDQADATAKKMEQYLYERGYFNPKVEFEPPVPKKQKTVVTYEVTTNERYYFDTLSYSSKDTAIHQILQEIKEESIIESGAPVDKTLYDGEIRRITQHLKDNGYANFFTNYIPPIEGDSTGQKVNAEFRVLLTKDSAAHQIYTIGDVYVDLLFNPRDTSTIRNDTIIDGIHFLSTNPDYYINPKAITPKIFFRKNDLYQLSNLEKTRKQLGELDIFQFVELKRIPHPELENVLNYEIRLIPKKRMEGGIDFEVNRSTIITNSRSFLGLATSLNYTNRNIFKGGEVFTARAEGGVEINPAADTLSIFSSWNLNLGGDLYFPKLMDHPLGTTKLVRKLSPSKYDILVERANTKASLNYNVISAVNQYRINIFAGSWGYEWRNRKNGRFLFNQMGVNFLDPIFSENFRINVLSLNPFLQRSLTEQLFTGFIARDFTAILQSNVDKKGRSWFFRGNVEQSGAEIAAVNGIYNTLSSQIETDTFRFLGNKYEFSQYLRLELDGRFNWQRSASRSWAFRTHVGIATPFAFSNDVPYTKQFSVGGPTSMRGWIIRELGPGSAPTSSSTVGTAFFQTGDLKLEMNAEYRFNIFWVFKGAIFLDAGNVWAIGPDERKGANFNLNEIAVSGGLGLRMDASIFLLRLDFGYKLREPIPDGTGRYWRVRTPSDFKWKDWNPNLAIGYPF